MNPDKRLQDMIREASASEDYMLGYQAFKEAERQGLEKLEILRMNKVPVVVDDFGLEEQVFYKIFIKLPNFGEREGAYFSIYEDYVEIDGRFYFHRQRLRISLEFTYDGKWGKREGFIRDDDTYNEVPSALQEAVLYELCQVLDSRLLEIIPIMKKCALENAKVIMHRASFNVAELQRRLREQQELCGQQFLKKKSLEQYEQLNTSGQRLVERTYV